MAIDPFLVKQGLIAAVPAGVLGFGVFAWLWWRSPRSSQPASREAALDSARRFAPTIALGVAVVGVWCWLNGWPVIPPKDAFGWIPLLAIVAFVAGVVVDIPTRSRWPGVLALVICGGLSGWVSSRSLMASSWSLLESVKHLGLFGLLLATFVAGLLRMSRETGATGAVCLAVPVLAASQLLVLDFDSLGHGLVAGSLCAFLAPAVIVGLCRPQLRVPRGASAAVGVVLATSLFQASLFGGAEPGAGLLYCTCVAVSPWAAAVLRWRPKREWLRALAAIAAMSIPLGVAMAVSLARSILASEADPYAAVATPREEPPTIHGS